MATNSVNKKGKCINITDCENAKSNEIIEIGIGNDFICPKCGGMLVPVTSKPPTPIWLIIVLAVLLLAGGGTAAYFLLSDKEAKIEIPEGLEEPVTETPVILISSIAIDATTAITMKVGDKQEIGLTILPENATNKEVEWISSESTVISVAGGTISALTKGNASVIAKTIDGSNLSTNVEVQVKEVSGGSGGNSGVGTGIAVEGGIYKGETKNGKPHGTGTITYSRRTLIDDIKQRYADPGDYVTGQFKDGRIVTVKWYNSSSEYKETVIP